MGFFYESGSGGFMSNVPKAVKHIILINVLVYVMTAIRPLFMYETFSMFFPLSPNFHFWQPFTYMFMHGNFFHLFFNMYTLFIFGSVLERVWGTKKFLLFYFVTGIGAVLVHAGVQFYQYYSLLSASGALTSEITAIADQMAQVLFPPTVGASGAIYGILMGYAMLYPDSIMTLIFPPISLKAKWFVLIFAGIELFTGVTGTQDGVAHFAHLMYWKKTRQLYGRFD